MKRDRWPSRTLFIFAAVGSSVGLGNIWRFPFLVGKYGGGAFLLPYLILMLAFGLPLLILEFSLGQKMQFGPIKALEKINKRFSGVGLSAVLCSFGVSCYYAVILAWTILYMFYSLTLAWGDSTKTFFYNEVINISASPSEIGDINTPVIAALIACWVMVYFCIWKGVESVSTIVKVTMPLPIALLVILLIRTASLPGALSGLEYFLKPDFQALLDTDVWMAAVSQVFFSLTLGFGVMIAYGSYRKTTADIVKSAAITALADVSVALLSGFVVFTTLGYMSQSSSLPIQELAASGPSLAFIVFPQALSMVPGAPLFAFLFFLALLTLGIDSLFSLVEALASVCHDRWPFMRKQDLVLYLCVGCFIGGFTFTTAGGLYYLDITDHFITSYGLVAVSLMEAIAVGWFYGARRMQVWINQVSDWSIGSWWNASIRYFGPVVLFLLLITSLYSDVVNGYGGYSFWALLLWGWGAVAAVLGLGIIKTWSVPGSNR